MKKRLMAILLCLSVLLMACACAAETMEPPAASQPESKAPAPQLPLSEVNAESSKTEEPAAPSETAPAESEPQGTISMEESEIELEPIQPIVPVEKETTLELVYDISLNDARSPILLQYYEDPTQAEIVIPHSYTMDLNGDIYCIFNDGLCKLGSKEGFRLRDGNDVDRLVSSMAVYDGIIYVTYTDIEKNSGSISVFDITGKVLSSTTLPATRSMEFFNVYLSGEGTPNVLIQNYIYSLEGHKIGAFYELDASKTSAYGVDVGKFSYPMTHRPLVLSNMGGVLTVKETQTKWFGTSAEGRHSVSEEIFYQYDNAGNPISKFKMTEIYCNQELPCKIAIGEAVCKKTTLETVVIGKTVFENVFDASVFAGADGELYAILVYTDGTKIYRINPGYSDVEMTDLNSIDNHKSECSTCQEAEGGSFSASTLLEEEVRSADAET